MPFAPRRMVTRKRRSVYGRRRRFRKRRSRAVISHKKFSYSKVFFFKKLVAGSGNISVGTDTITQIATGTDFKAGTFLYINFRLSDIPDYTSITSLFNEFKIYKVVMKLIPTAIQTVSQGVTTTGANPGGVLASVLVPSGYPNASTTLLSSYTQLEQYHTLKYQSVFSRRHHTRVIKPNMSALAGVPQDASTFTANTMFMAKRPWVPSLYFENATYTGLILFLSNASSASTVLQSYWIQFTYYIAARNVY